MSELADYYSIYEGVWINWARGRVFGSTITLNRRDGGLIISFITLFITLVGTAFGESSASPFIIVFHLKPLAMLYTISNKQPFATPPTVPVDSAPLFRFSGLGAVTRYIGHTSQYCLQSS